MSLAGLQLHVESQTFLKHSVLRLSPRLVMFHGKWNKASLVSLILYEVLQDFDGKMYYNFIK